MLGECMIPSLVILSRQVNMRLSTFNGYQFRID